MVYPELPRPEHFIDASREQRVEIIQAIGNVLVNLPLPEDTSEEADDHIVYLDAYTQGDKKLKEPIPTPYFAVGLKLDNRLRPVSALLYRPNNFSFSFQQLNPPLAPWGHPGYRRTLSQLTAAERKNPEPLRFNARLSRQTFGLLPDDVITYRVIHRLTRIRKDLGLL